MLHWQDKDEEEAAEENQDGETQKKTAAGDDSDEENQEDGGPLSKKKLKKVSRLSVAELKQLVDKPDVVEVSQSTLSLRAWTFTDICQFLS